MFCIVCLLLLYSGFEVLRYLVSASDEHREFELFKVEMLSEEPVMLLNTDTAGEMEQITVSHYALNQLLKLPVGSIGLIERRSNKNTVYKYDGEKYPLLMVKEELLEFSGLKGLHWLSYVYGINLERSEERRVR